jgi:hypothetical protein
VKHARACLAGRCNFGIVCTRESFVVDRVALPAGRAQELGGLDGKVLIELRAHRAKLRREGQDSLLGQVGGIRQRRLNARHRERGIALDDLLGGQPVCQVRKNHGDGNSRATDARLSVEDSQIDGDVFAPVHIAIVANVCGLLGTDSRGGRDA